MEEAVKPDKTAAQTDTAATGAMARTVSRTPTGAGAPTDAPARPGITPQLNRRELFTLLAAAPAACLAVRSEVASAAQGAAAAGVPAPLHKFIGEYMRAMNAPGLTLGLASSKGTVATAAYGFANLASKEPVTTAHRFEIGSITKSFAALVVLQLQDEGKLDVQHPIVRYLPWLPIETEFGEITLHHLLTHTSGMPEDPPIVPIEPRRRVRQAYEPGKRFHYSNWAFDVIGHLIEKVDGRPWPVAVKSRIFDPLGMNDTVGEISSAQRTRIANSYMPLHDDRPYPRHGELASRGILTMTDAAGSIASTPGDMARYIQMILNGGVGPSGRVVSERAFKLFTTPHTDAPAFGPKASYGYGIAIDQLDGHKRLRHTGGMVSFMSAIHIDLEAGVGAFASINAQQGYRPNPVAEYAVRLLRGEGHITPPVADAADVVSDPASYTGVYRSPGGRTLEVKAQGNRLVLVSEGTTIPLQRSDDEQFIALHQRFALYPIYFGRAEAAPDASPDSPPPPITELSYGSEWYAHSRFTGAHEVAASPGLVPYEGYYYSENPWVGSVRIVQRRGQLWMNGTTPLAQIGNHVFRPADEPMSPVTLEFFALLDGATQGLYLDGNPLRRLVTAET
ncbi:MAG TPA: serine hydrolase domain-containing protein [Steroidobacteraceae bacterium]|nr:serine hydrolase domain-containing protein [Steroidobacteraceae bacterium]